MGIQAIIDNRISVIHGLNASLTAKRHPLDNATAFRCFQPSESKASSDASLALETQKGSRLFEVYIDGIPVDAGGSGVYDTLWIAQLVVRIRYDSKGLARTMALASVDSAWITRSLIDPTNYGSVTEFEATSPATVTTETDTVAGSLIVTMTFPTTFYESSLATI